MPELPSSPGSSSIEILPPSIREDELMQALLDTHERIFELDLGVLLIHDFDNVIADALPALAEQFLVTGYRGWLLAETEADKRTLLKNAIALHKTAGTPYAIRLAMASIGFPNAVVEENPPLRYDGSWTYDGNEVYNGKKLGAFIVTLAPDRAPVSTAQIELIIQLINIWKTTRSELIDLRIGSISLFRNLLLYNGQWNYDGSQTYDGILNI